MAGLECDDHISDMEAKHLCEAETKRDEKEAEDVSHFKKRNNGNELTFLTLSFSKCSATSSNQ